MPVSRPQTLPSKHASLAGARKSIAAPGDVVISAVGRRQVGRREVLAMLGVAPVAALAGPGAARAQQGGLRKVGVLMYYADGDPEGKDRLATLRDRLEKLGWNDGRNVAIEARWTAGRADGMLVFPTELVTQPVDVIVAASTPLLGVLKKLTSTIPIVFTQVADPAGSGFVTNYARPGGNITGFTDFDPAVAGKWLEILKEAAPRVSHVMVLFDPEQANHKRFLDVIESSAPSFQVQIAVVTAHNRDEIEEALAKTAGQEDTGLIVLPGPLYNTQRAAIVAAAARHRVRRCIRSNITSPTAASYTTAPISSRNGKGPPATSTASSRARSRPTCRCRRRPNTSWSSISKPPRRSALPCRRR